MNAVEMLQQEMRAAAERGPKPVSGEGQNLLAARCYLELAWGQVEGAIGVDEFADGKIPPPGSEWPWGIEEWDPHVLAKVNVKKAAGLLAGEWERLQRLG